MVQLLLHRRPRQLLAGQRKAPVDRQGLEVHRQLLRQTQLGLLLLLLLLLLGLLLLLLGLLELIPALG